MNLFSRMLNIALTTMLAIWTAAACAQEGPRRLALSSEPSMTKSIAKVLLEREAGASVDDAAISVEGVSINGFNHLEIFALADSPYFCPDGVCRIRLFALIGDSYRDLLAGNDQLTAVPVDQISILGDSNGEYRQLAFGDAVLAWNGKAYVDRSSVTPTTLSGAVFLPICNAYSGLEYAINDSGGDVARERPEVCGCVVEGFGARGLSQDDLDLFAAYLDGTVDETARSDKQEALAWAYNNGFEVQTSCMVAHGGTAAVPPSVSEPVPASTLDVAHFVASCRAQDWILSAKRVGSADRALALCSCLAGGFESAGMAQDDVDGLVQVYDGAMTEDELTEARPDAIAASDGVSENCLRDLPPR